MSLDVTQLQLSPFSMNCYVVKQPDADEAVVRRLVDAAALPELLAREVVAAVHETLRGEAEPETDGREGLRSLELLIGIYISARDGRRVTLPLDY